MFKKLLMLVILVLGVVMAVPSLRSQLVDEIRPYSDQVKSRFVPRRLKAMADQLDVRLGRAEGFPVRFDMWLRRDFTGSPQDPWGNLYYLEIGRRDYVVGSMGPDGRQGTEDDIREPARPIPGAR